MLQMFYTGCQISDIVPLDGLNWWLHGKKKKPRVGKNKSANV